MDMENGHGEWTWRHGNVDRHEHGNMDREMDTWTWRMDTEIDRHGHRGIHVHEDTDMEIKTWR
jgi:hypothetical protein